jgi:geranylgeranyl diphosphate synthase type I
MSAPTRSVPVPASLLLVAERVEHRLAEVLDLEIERWGALDDSLDAPLHDLRDFVLNGGKRLRPAFCHWGFVAAGGDEGDSRTIDAGAAFELLHAFALFHDDVMDGSSVRRGERTAHLAFADEHESSRWSGEARRFGEGVAILIGDLAFVYADQLLGGAPPAAWSVWNELRVELNVGQYLDIRGAASGERRLVVADRIARYKSGKYTVERPLHLGALLAEPSECGPLVESLSAYGLPLGDAFQMRDDVLGAFGDESLTGKPVGDDLREGKPTPLLAIATERASAEQREVLTTVGAPDLTPEQVGEIQAVLVGTGALDELERRIDRLLAAALRAIDTAPITEPAREALVDLAHYVAWRHA